MSSRIARGSATIEKPSLVVERATERPVSNAHAAAGRLTLDSKLLTVITLWIALPCLIAPLLASVMPPLALHAATLDVQWGPRIEVARGEGRQGPWRMNESVFRYVDDPAVAVNADGATGVAWVDQADKSVLFQLYGTDLQPRLRRPTNVSRSPRVFSWLPRMVMTSSDPVEVYILWQEIVFSGGSHGGEAFFARSIDGGETFSEPLNLSNDEAGSGKGRIHAGYWHNGSLDLAIGPQGHLYAVWTDYEGALWLRRSTDGGASFSPARRIVGGRGKTFVRAPALAVDRQGTLYLAWTVGEDRAADIHFTMSSDGGQSFTTPRVLFESDGYADAPKVAVDGDGTVHLAYGQSVSGPFDRYSIHYARSTDGGRSFETPREVSHPRTHPLGSVNFPGLGLGSPASVYLVWELYPVRGNRPRGLGFTYSTDGGRSFHPPSVVPGSLDPPRGVNGSLQGQLMQKIAANAAGRIAVVNSTFDPGRASYVWLFPGRAAEHPDRHGNDSRTQTQNMAISIPVVSGGSVGGTDATVEPARTYSRRLSEGTTGIGSSRCPSTRTLLRRRADR